MRTSTRNKRTESERTSGWAGEDSPRSTSELPPLPSLEAMEGFLASLTASGFGKPSPVEKAQSIMYEAWDTPTERQAVALAKVALEISADCADAYVMLADLTAVTAEEALELYQKGVEAGERALGKETFQRDAGHFWGILETRPYMRARSGLAECLWATGRREKAVEHYWEMLRLNPGDNQGIRYQLMPCLIRLDRDKEAQKLHRQYKDDCMANWAYSKALLDFRKHGAGKRADKSLRAAFKANKYVPDYLLDPERLPDSLPEYVTFGGDGEAVEYAFFNWLAWDHTPVSLYWLASQW